MRSNPLPSRKRIWTGRVITALPVLFLVFDASMKFTTIAPVTEATARLGWPVGLNPVIALLELVCLTVYLVPRTAVIGGVLLTGFLGGAIATHVRIGDPLFSHVLFPTYIGALFWLGLYLRDDRVQAILRAHRGIVTSRSTVSL